MDRILIQRFLRLPVFCYEGDRYFLDTGFPYFQTTMPIQAQAVTGVVELKAMGVPALKRYTKIDFRNNEIVTSGQPIELPGAKSVPMKISRFGWQVCMTVGGLEKWCFIDTGAAYSYVRGVGEDGAPVGKVYECGFGGNPWITEVRRVPCSFDGHDFTALFGQVAKNKETVPTDGVMGVDFFDKFTVVVDQVAQTMQYVVSAPRPNPEIRQWHGGEYLLSAIGSVALEFDGHKILKERLLHGRTILNSGECDIIVRFDENRYYLRAMLFIMQRYFGKGGGELLPESHRDYSVYYFLFLQCYRDMLEESDAQFRLNSHRLSREDREVLAACLRKAFADLGDDDLASFDEERISSLLHAEVRTSVPPRPDEVLAQVFEGKMGEMDPNRAIQAFKSYVAEGRVDEDDNVNGMVFAMLKRHLSSHPESDQFPNRSYIYYALMYLHLYRGQFGEHAWRQISWPKKEHVASVFRTALSTMREYTAINW